MAESPRTRPVTQTQVARAAGVSRGLVSLALAGSTRVAEETREHILATARELGYRVNRTAATLASGRSGLVGLILPDLRNPFFDFIAVSLQEAARDAGLTLLMTLARPATSSHARGGRDAIEALLDMQVEGLLLVSPGMSDAQLRALGESVPVCVVGRASAGGRVDTVRLDEAAAAHVVVDHLRQAGATRLIYLTNSVDTDPNSGERGAALAEAARTVRLPFQRVVQENEGAARVRELASRAEAEGEHAGVIAHNDVVALDALAALRAGALRAPLVSYDDTYLAQREEFSLTSVEQPAEVMARDAIQFLCERSGRLPLAEEIADAGAHLPARNVTVPPVLAVRASSQV